MRCIPSRPTLALLIALTLTLTACGGDDGGGGSSDGADTGAAVADTGAAVEDTGAAQDTAASPEDTGAEDTEAPPMDTEAPPEDTEAPPEDTGAEDTGAPEDAADAEVDVPPVDNPFPERLQVRWVNTQPNDRVTFGKRLVVEIEPLTEGIAPPSNWREEQLWSRRFPARMYTLNRDGDRVEVPVIQSWKFDNPERRFRPAILISPQPNGWPKASQMELEVDLGDGEVLSVPFRTLPVQYDQMLEFNVTVPAQDCPTCFPYDVDMFVYLPPGYVDSNNPAYNNAAPHLPGTEQGDTLGGSTTQRYPVAVLMHTAGAYENNRERATLAGLRMSWGIMEPTIIVLPNARLDSGDCDDNPQLRSQNCHTRFVGLWRADEKIFSYRDWLAEGMQQFLRENFRVRGSNDEGQITDPEITRRSHSLYGSSAGGYGVLINCFSRPDAYYACAAIVPGVVSGFNPYSHYGIDGRGRNGICPSPSNSAYPLERWGLGYRDYSGVDPETDRRRVVHFDEREIRSGARNCYQSLPAQNHDLVRSGLCELDIACNVDPEAPRSVSNGHKLRDESPYHGNIYFDTAIFDTGGPPAAFMELDELLDRGGVPHTFRYEDRGGLFHRVEAIYDRLLGYEYIQNPNDLPLLRGNFPGPGIIFPFLSNAMEGIGNPEFNSPTSSEYTTGALDPDRDQIIYIRDPERPDINYELDNCPDVYNPPQVDKDNDGLGDLCDDDIDGDGIPNDEDPCNWPDLPVDPLDPDGPTVDGCANDRDGDGILDSVDLCPDTFDPLQLDTDRDNFGDACDIDDDNDGILDDGDGSGVIGDNPCNHPQIENCDDNCVTERNGTVADPNNPGATPQADLDGNGLGDICDPTCLLRPNSDGDGDGTPCISDCNDGDPTIHPGAEEICGDGIDQDCSGVPDDGACE